MLSVRRAVAREAGRVRVDVSLTCLRRALWQVFLSGLTGGPPATILQENQELYSSAPDGRVWYRRTIGVRARGIVYVQ